MTHVPILDSSREAPKLGFMLKYFRTPINIKKILDYVLKHCIARFEPGHKARILKNVHIYIVLLPLETYQQVY